jgi:hypothetical protein
MLSQKTKQYAALFMLRARALRRPSRPRSLAAAPLRRTLFAAQRLVCRSLRLHLKRAFRLRNSWQAARKARRRPMAVNWDCIAARTPSAVRSLPRSPRKKRSMRRYSYSMRAFRQLSRTKRSALRRLMAYRRIRRQAKKHKSRCRYLHKSRRVAMRRRRKLRLRARR